YPCVYAACTLLTRVCILTGRRRRNSGGLGFDESRALGPDHGHRSCSPGSLSSTIFYRARHLYALGVAARRISLRIRASLKDLNFWCGPDLSQLGLLRPRI